MPCEASLNESDTSRLRRCIATVADPSRPLARWPSLEQLAYFCDGADEQLLETIGGRSFSTLPTLVGLLEEVDAAGGAAAVLANPSPHNVPVGLVLQLLESLLCSAPNNLRTYLKIEQGVRLLVRILGSIDAFAQIQAMDAYGLVLVDRACNVLCYLTYSHPDAVEPFLAADGVALVTRVMQHVHAHYKRTLSRPGSAARHRPPPEAPPATWDGLARNTAELISNVSSASATAQRALALGGALRTILDLLPLFTGKSVPTDTSHTWVAEELLLAASKLIWCLPRAQTMLLDGETLNNLLRSVSLSYDRIMSPNEAATQHDIVVYQATVLLLLNAKLENKPMQNEVGEAMNRLTHGSEIATHLSTLASVYYQLFDTCEHINLNHFHSDEVMEGLRLVTRLLSSEEEAPYLFVHMNGRLDLLMRCLSNIDEEVLFAACCALYCLISRSPPARLLFLRKRGIGQLFDCLHDYNTAILTTSLQILCLLASESEAAREEMRREEVLLGVLRIVERFPAEDVTLGVLDAALEAISHIVLDSAINQEYIRTNGGLLPILLALQHCSTRVGERSASAPTSHRAAANAAAANGRMARPSTAPTASRGRDERYGYALASERERAGAAGASWPEAGEHVADALKVTETACSALGNVVFRHPDNQREALEAGVLTSCLRLLETHEPSAHVAALNLLVNLTDTNPQAQEMLCEPASSHVLLSLLERSEDGGVLCCLCLLLSHAVWNHPGNQRTYGSHDTIRQLICFLAPPERCSPAARGASTDRLVLYALMALVNLTYGNAEVQRTVRELGGLPAVEHQLMSAAYEVRRSASFCLGNLVKDNPANAAALVNSGGVELLLLCLNDEEEDELSKTAYSTICQLGGAGLVKLLSLITDASAALKESDAGSCLAARCGGGQPGARAEVQMFEEDFEVMNLDDHMHDEAQSVNVARKPPKPPQTRPCSAATAGQPARAVPSYPADDVGVSLSISPIERLELCLPVVNGMIYTIGEMRQIIIDGGGLSTILRLLPRAPPHIQEEALHVVLNSTYSQPADVKQFVLDLGMVSTVAELAAVARERGQLGVAGMCYAAICSLAEGFERACAELAADSALIEQLVSSCSAIGHQAGSDETEMVERATELFLVLFNSPAAKSAILRHGGLHCLEELSACSQSQLHAARARQALHEHRGGFT